MSAQATEGRHRSPLLITILILGVLTLLIVIASRFYTDFLWFSSLSATTVFTTQLAARIGLFVTFGVVLAGAVSLALRIA